ncbi:hypothetical protein T484DRAFT_1772409 [Baffinella frigidus]|nr:hypothetical protein T484DRAFT_1772409 [Cryptophyta sp. CCMP2293]
MSGPPRGTSGVSPLKLERDSLWNTSNSMDTPCPSPEKAAGKPLPSPGSNLASDLEAGPLRTQRPGNPSPASRRTPSGGAKSAAKPGWVGSRRAGPSPGDGPVAGNDGPSRSRSTAEAARPASESIDELREENKRLVEQLAAANAQAEAVLSEFEETLDELAAMDSKVLASQQEYDLCFADYSDVKKRTT